MSDIWEPWAPEVGQRVRTRISAECPYRARKWSQEKDNGRSGVVVAHLEGDKVVAPGHRFKVRLDDGRLARAAAIELEPVE